MSIQVLSKFSVPSNSGILYAIVPEPRADAIRRLQRDDPIWNHRLAGCDWEWRILPEECRLRVRDRIKFWWVDKEPQPEGAY